MIFDIINGTYKGRSTAISPCDLINFYPELEDGERAKNVKALIGTPGLVRGSYEAGSGGYGRALHCTASGYSFAINGNKLYETIGTSYAYERGTLSSSVGQCYISDNGVELFITDGVYGYTYNWTTHTFSQITDSDFPSSPGPNIFTDGYFIVVQTTSGKFFYSNSYDGTSWDALDYATAEYSSDTLKSVVKTSNGVLFFVGTKSIELWTATGDTNLPWQRINGSTKEIGTYAKNSVKSDGTNMFFVGGDKNGYAGVFMSSGYDIVRISDPHIEYTIRVDNSVSSASAYTYSYEGHSFYVVNFSSNLTLAYDITTKMWHKRCFQYSAGVNVRHIIQDCMFVSGNYIVNAYNNGYLYYLTSTSYVDGDTGILREIITKSINSENKLIRHLLLEMDLQKGVGNTSAVNLYYSNDGGNTWSSALTKYTGATSDYTYRLRWSRLGTSRDRVYKFTFTAAVQWIIINAYLKADGS